MGRFPAPVASLNASAKRKPLSLKPERKNSPKKASSKFVVFGDKENQTAAHGNQMAVVASQQLKKATSVTCTEAEESEERAALRKKVEEAVAFHLANRSPPGSPVPAKAFEKSNAAVTYIDVCQSPETQEETECDVGVSAPSKSTRGQTVRVVLAVLLVFAIAVWSGVRVALLKPDNALVKYQPYVRQGVDFFVSKLDAITALSASADEFILTAMPSDVEIVTAEGLSESFVLDASIACDETVDVAVIEERVDAADLSQEAPSEAEQVQAQVELELVGSADVEVVPQVVLQIAPPVGRTQLVLRKAFDILTPLKKVFAQIQDKLVHVMHGISRFFQRKMN